MSDTRELYQLVILDHNRSPRNFRAMDGADRVAEGYNPMCGDQLKVWVRFDGDRIADVSFHGSGCAISKASASLMTTAVVGKTREEAKALFEGFHRMLTTEGDTGAGLPSKLAVFAGVREFPMRVKCATLSWHALKSTLENPAS
ncbi:MAG TPA: SUF system NifU family Fe-S cluster assembly protein [Gemmatimonadales bacterium]|nr:SUF system NifU family Fe-S cluster assembly protein [Gemmatimonadales bacterium]